MKKQVKIGIAAGVCAVCVTAGGIFAAFSDKKTRAEDAMLSYGVGVIAADTDMAMSAPVGNDIVFSADAFARALNLPKIDYITVQSLPSTAAGELLLGSTRVAAGETISGENLSYLTFTAAADDLTHASFTFTANGGLVPMVCNLYLLNEINYTPTVSVASGLSLNVSTYRDMPTYGRLSAYDPDGDTLIFEVVSYPKNGSVRLENKETGNYVYVPEKDFTGTDSFSYVARDKYGNYSAAATVNLRVETSGISLTYADMLDSRSHIAALTLTESGIMSGEQIGNQYFFHPTDTVTRAEFLVMAMHAAGISDVPSCDTTVFADDAEIPDAMKGYVAAAYEMKYISGTLVEGKLCFLPNEEITRAQAAVMLSNIVGLCDVPVVPTFADHSEIPVWASEAIYSLSAAGIMSGEGGYIAPTEQITREQTATMLAAAMAYVKS